VEKERQQKININKAVGDLINWVLMYEGRVKWRTLVKRVIHFVR